ncbi:MAG: threonylcarbamoyl-AMP synthase [Candidatus Sungbacteria bacterium RIFCSPHIGHO2_02_FULL_52_23]|uniref:L-threonylcarbamoyladenylate synthase n=1 Tax=Candidatus Sungbacteria bacterium RIFCSPHIGHO2_02_FULL_52_23 TaxID=1802274 RepID=A0A1G2KZC2_9BACT|nr:MAG: threonylcarbamoyl-AMP synthase [Candidatus Sungbacteria bacterium RIFCSPHIGHO2_02_FULL_52_23]
MKTILLTDDSFASALAEAKRVLMAGGVVIAPTDTVYGILGDATNERAIRAMFAIKRRPAEKAFPIFVKDIADAKRFAYISDPKAKFLERVWPGAVTATFQHKGKLPVLLTGGRDTIGIRMPDHQLLLKLLAELSAPLAQTSANISSESPAKTAEEAIRYFEKSDIKPDLVIDGGRVPGVSSTVIDCTGVSPLILRTGIMTKQELDRVLDTF